MPSDRRTWEYDYHQYVTIDLGAGVVRWEDTRRGCEGGADQPVAEFIARGPLSVGELSRRIQLEMLTMLSLAKTPWLEPSSTVELPVGGVKATFYVDSTLEVHGQVLLRRGTLARSVRIRGLDWAADTEFHTHESGEPKSGTLASAAEIDGRRFAAGQPIGLHPDGSLAFPLGG